MTQFKIPSPVRLKKGLMESLKEKLAYVAPGVKAIEFENTDEKRPIIVMEYEGELEENLFKGKVSDMVRAFARGFIDVEKEILFDRRDVTPCNSEPVFEKMIQAGWVHPYETGRVLLSGPAKRLFDFFDAEFAKIATRYSATPDKYPVLISVDTLKTADYFSSFPHHITLASHLAEDATKIREFSDRTQEGIVDFDPLDTKTGHVCSPAVCFHLYQALEHRTLKKVECRTAVGPCFRYESANMTTLERLWDFTMREIIFVGPSAEVDVLRQSAMEPVMELVDRLGLKSHIETASDPFFVSNYAGQTFYQLSHKTKYELQLYLPQKEGGSLAAASFNWHQTFFGSKFEIKAGDEVAGTGCVAFGIERWVHAFVSQYGLDMSTWPPYLLENW